MPLFQYQCHCHYQRCFQNDSMIHSIKLGQWKRWLQLHLLLYLGPSDVDFFKREINEIFQRRRLSMQFYVKYAAISYLMILYQHHQHLLYHCKYNSDVSHGTSFNCPFCSTSSYMEGVVCVRSNLMFSKFKPIPASQKAASTHPKKNKKSKCSEYRF